MNNIFSEVQRMLEPLARKMAGHDVTVNVHPMFGANASGRASKDAMGRVCIDLSSRLDMDGMYITFLHEMGHICMGDVTPKSPSPKAWERAKFTKAEEALYTRHVSEPAELKADIFAGILDERITKKAMSLYGRADSYTKFKTLNEHVQEIIK